MKRSLLIMLRRGPQILLSFVLVLLALLAIRFFSRDTFSLADRLNIISATSTVALVVITAIYARLTGKTLAHLREERISSAEPQLYLTLDAGSLEPDARVLLKIQNFGRGPAIRILGEYRCRSERLHGQWLRHRIRFEPSILPVGFERALIIPLTEDDLKPLTGDRHDGFLDVRLVYEDARRNLYVYRLSLTLLQFQGHRFVQEYSEKLWRIVATERDYIFDNDKLSVVLEFGRRPLFARGLGFDSDDHG